MSFIANSEWHTLSNILSIVRDITLSQSKYVDNNTVANVLYWYIISQKMLIWIPCQMKWWNKQSLINTSLMLFSCNTFLCSVSLKTKQYIKLIGIYTRPNFSFILNLFSWASKSINHHKCKGILWPIFACKVCQSVPIGMKLGLDLWYILDVYTKFQIDISKHVEKSLELFKQSKTCKNICPNSENKIFA